MFEFWLKLQYWDSILSILLFLFVILTLGVVAIIKSWQWTRKIRWLRNHGFSRYLMNVSAFGDGALYGWKNEVIDRRISEIELRQLSYKELISKFV